MQLQWAKECIKNSMRDSCEAGYMHARRSTHSYGNRIATLYYRKNVEVSYFDESFDEYNSIA
jgi:hypothetical protein